MASVKGVDPQTLYPEVLETSVSACTLDVKLYISDQLCFFAGHFPEFAIVPGVIQVNWVVQFARELLGLTAAVLNVEKLKFTCPIQPNMRVMLHVDVDFTKNSANFCFHSSERESSPLIFSQGRLVYERVDE